MRPDAWKLGSGLGLLAVVAFLLLDDEVARETLWRAVLVAAVGGVVVGIRRNRPVREGPWWLIATALMILTVSNLLDHPLWAQPWAQPVADGLAMLAFPLIGLGALAMTRCQVPGGDRDSAIDGAIVMIAMATLLAGTVYRADHLLDEVALVSRLLNTVVAPVMMAAIAAAAFRLLFVGSLRIVAAWLMVVAAMSALLGNIARALLLSSGGYERGVWTDVLILLAYILIPIAALHPSSPALTAPADRVHRRFTYARLVVLGAALLSAPIALLLRGIDGQQRITVLASVLLALLVLWRLGRLAIERERTRRMLQLRAERQGALADLGRRALREPDVDTVISDVLGRCNDHLDVHHCEVTVPEPGGVVDDVVAVPVAEDGRVLRVVVGREWGEDDLAFLLSAANLIAVAIERSATSRLLHDAAMHDALTGLPNRALILDRLGHALTRRHHPGLGPHVLFIDLDGFKRVNDDLGHQAGDDVLVEVAVRLLELVRDGDTVGRLAGDEFVVLCEDVTAEEAGRIANRIIDTLHRPYTVAERDIRVTASVGLSAPGDVVVDAELALAQADAAMYVAKEQPGVAVAAFDGALGAAQARRRTLERELEVAVEADELALVFQPLLRLEDARPIGAEALLRWEHPIEGRRLPGSFLPTAELSNLILPVGGWVLDHAMQQLAIWQTQLDPLTPWRLYVNLAGRQLADARLVAEIAGLLERYAIDPRRIGFEVAETAVVDDRVVATATSLSALGVGLALDDFGTGYASIAHLRRLPLDVIKLDGSLAARVDTSPPDRAIIRAVCSLGHELGLSVLAERIETEAQRSVLEELGCDLGQGYLLGRPMEPEALQLPATLIRRRSAPVTATAAP